MSKASKNKPIIEGVFVLKRMPDKGGWTYLELPQPRALKRGPFGHSKINGSIDNYELKDQGFWSMKNGKTFLPVKAEIRKQIGKEAGQKVNVKLFMEILPEVQSSEFMKLLKEEPAAQKRFKALSAERRQELLHKIDTAPNDEARVDQMAKTLRFLAGY